MAGINIVDYTPEYQPYFEKFNKDWIEKFFWLEETDRYVLSFPQQAVIDKGGLILMALYENEPAGTVALKKLNENIYEFSKMAVTDRFKRKGIAEALSWEAIKRAQALEAEKIILYSQTDLEPAITLYKKLGFVIIPLEPGTYQRANIKMELIINKLEYSNR